MTLIINGKPEQVETGTLAQLVGALGFAEAIIATALNGSFVPKGRRSGTELREGDRVEILAPMQGG